MRIALVAGPPTVGKTSVLRHALRPLPGETRGTLFLAKLDCLTGIDVERFRSIGVEPRLSLSDDVCPDHHFAVQFGEMYAEATLNRADLMVIETAGLCDRCSPFLERVPAVAVLSFTASLQGPARMKAIAAHADLVVLTHGELISQAEREVFRGAVRSLNRACMIMEVNGLTGEGATQLTAWIASLPDCALWDRERLRYPLPRGTCELCSGGF